MKASRQRIPLEEFRSIALEQAKHILADIAESVDIRTSGFQKQQPSPLLSYASSRDLAVQCRDLMRRLPVLKLTPDELKRVGTLDTAVSRVDEARTALDLLSGYFAMLDRRAHGPGGVLQFGGMLTADERFVYLDPPDSTAEAMSESGDAVLNAAARAADGIRAATRSWEPAEVALVDWAAHLVDNGAAVRNPFRPLGTPGFSEFQTSLSLADPGPGHLAVTVRSAKLLRGTVVHVEHIDRDSVSDKEAIEAYRLSSPRLAARVRLAVGTTTPVTAYIGRPVFENHRFSLDAAAMAASPQFDWDLLKSAHMTAAACSVMFMNGISDCKVAIERMTSRQAVRFMRAVAGNVVRDRYRQTLAAAFNINTPIVDDRESSVPVLIQDRAEIARIGVALTCEGGFDKIAWDGASNAVPSVPFTEQLSFDTLVGMVHEAHLCGLLTYFSAGMRSEHMGVATETGVDGVGIGTSLHHRDTQTNLMGALRPEAIEDVLATRDAVSRTPIGRASTLLARVDRMMAEGSFPESDQPLAQQLFDAVRARDENACNGACSRLELYAQLPNEQGHPLIERAQRVLAATRLGAPLVERVRLSPGDRPMRARMLERSLGEGDLRSLEALL